MKNILKRQVQELLDAKYMEPSDNPWASGVLLVGKKDPTDGLRFVIDYRRLNGVFRLTSYPLPTMDSVLDSMLVAQAT